jgi:D-alanine transaminase
MPVPLANLNGALLPLADVQISAQDRGFLFGDAVYEVLRVYAGRPWLEEEHWQRLRHSLAAIRIEGVDLERLRRRMHQTIAAGPFGEAMVYLQITRGAAPRRHAFPKYATPLELLYVQDYDDGPTAQARQTGVAVITRPDIRWGHCDIKSTNLLPNVLVNQEAAEAGAAEAILYLPDGTLSEASHSSFFTVKGGALQTTPLRANILPGITRKFLIDMAQKAAVPVRETTLRREELFNVDELFLAGTTSEVLPVVTVDGKTIAAGTPGPLSRRLLGMHQEMVRSFLK